jgi:hypothetical protein
MKNKLSKGVFTEIVETEKKKSLFNQFITDVSSDDNGQTVNQLLSRYKKLISNYENVFKELALIEESILQIKTRESVRDIKLYMVRDYIYARTSFFRLGNDFKDIRIIVDKINNYGITEDNLLSLLENEKFMDKLTRKLNSVMDNEIKTNTDLLQINIDDFILTTIENVIHHEE